MMQLHVSYLTNSKGKKVAVQIPFNEWTELIGDYERLRQSDVLRNDLVESFREIEKIEKGEQTVSTLSDFLNEH